ncbi:VOC family protein [Spongisporangium articulatum]|uniref:VOC family protein n=1 Tax=Spongisporangium articulatum TaxID=3362603 RepID=A0ABW8AKQ1_9ACTN
MDMFAGVPVRDIAAAEAWYARFFGGGPSFRPNEAEAVWEIVEHGYVFLRQAPEHAGHAAHTLFVRDVDGWAARLEGADLKPEVVEEYENGVRKLVFHDPDGNELGIGGTVRQPTATRLRPV